jgi:bifunctional oligoribonuclease and PAP phosphatase NrnA
LGVATAEAPTPSRATNTRPTEADWSQSTALVRRAERLLLCSHQKPDGDAIGSILGLGHALESAGKHVTLACADAPINALAKLPGADRIIQDLSEVSQEGQPLRWDAVVVMDASGLDRLGGLYESNRHVFETLPVLNVDHHFTNDRFGEVNLVDATAAATTEVLVEFLRRMGIAPDPVAATCLLAGLMTDSLSFQTESTTGRSLRAAATLVEAGAPMAAIASQIFRQRPRGSAVLWSKALGTLGFGAGGRIAWVEVTREMVESSGPGAESGGLSNYASSIEGVDVGFLIEEGADGNVYVGLRSESVDVAAIAAEFGGGGHVRAAGCHFKAPATIASAREPLLAVIDRYLAVSPLDAG